MSFYTINGERRSLPPRYVSEMLTAEQVAAELRRDLGVSQERLDAYIPETAVRKCGREWTYDLIDGQGGRDRHPTKRAAIEAARRHKALKQDMMDRPSDFRDWSSVESRLILDRIEKHEARGVTGMEAARLAHADLDAELMARHKIAQSAK